MSAFVRNEINKEIDFVQMNNTLTTIKRQFNESSTDDDYTLVVKSLIELNIPYSIEPKEQGSVSISVGFTNINPELIAEVSGGKKINDVNELKEGIISWSNQNYDGTVKFEKITKFTDSGNVDLFSYFNLEIESKEKFGEAYLIIDVPMDEIFFSGQKTVKPLSQSSAVYLDVDDSTSEIEFIVKESVSPESLGAHIAPNLNKVNLEGGDFQIADEGGFRWGIFLFWIGVLIALTLVVYVILQEWYKRNYEKHIFRNPDDLYNLINFMYNSRHAGLPDKQSRKKLETNGWGGEQITYAFRKMDGKRTGMWELPIFKFFENAKVKKEIEKRHPGQDVRFIKQPEF